LLEAPDRGQERKSHVLTRSIPLLGDFKDFRAGLQLSVLGIFSVRQKKNDITILFQLTRLSEMFEAGTFACAGTV